MNKPLISVVTPSFNQGRFLEECFTSILDQGYPNLEYIVIDAGSRDETLDIIRKYESHISYWISEPDDGQSEAINKGFRRASGQLVTWLNADDYYMPGAFDAFAAAYEENPEASFYFGDGYRVEEDGSIKSNFFPDGALFDYDALVYGLNYILQPSAVINSVALNKAGFVDESLHYGMDSDLWMRLAKVSDPMPLSHVIACSREYGETKTSTGAFPRVEELRRISERHSGLPITPGALCYYLDALHRAVCEAHQFYPESFRGSIERFWEDTSLMMRRLNVDQGGFPLRSERRNESEEKAESSAGTDETGVNQEE